MNSSDSAASASESQVFKPLISVIVPVYNSEQYLEKCLDSIAQQTYSNLEIICVNDGSSDSSGQILDEYAAKDSRFRIIHKQNAGQAAARNDALNVATGDYVANVDSDDYLDLNAYELAMQHMTENVDVVWFGAHIVGDIEGKALADMEEFYRIKKPGLQRVTPEVFQHMSMAVWNKIVRRNLLNQYMIRYPEGMYFEDVCFVSFLAAVSNSIYFMEDKLYYYIQRSNSTMGNTRDGKKMVHLDFIRIMAPMYNFYKKWNLLNKKADIYNAFLTRCYNCIKVFSPKEHKREALLKFHDEVKRFRIDRVHTVSGIMHDLGLQLHVRRETKVTVMGLVLYSKSYHKGFYTHSLFGLNICQTAPAPSLYRKTPFYCRKKGTKEWRFFWIPLLSIKYSDGIKSIKLFSFLPISRSSY